MNGCMIEIQCMNFRIKEGNSLLLPAYPLTSKNSPPILRPIESNVLKERQRDKCFDPGETYIDTCGNCQAIC